MNDWLSWIASLVDGDVAETHLADYSYLGLGAAVIVDYTQPQVKYTLVSLTGTNDPNTGDIYTGLDRFGRVKDCRWYNYNAATDVARLKYAYDLASNRGLRDDTVATTAGKDFFERYQYDGLHRLRHMTRGNESGTVCNFAQCWTLDATGNWRGFREADGDCASWDLVQAGTANAVTEITDITNSNARVVAH